MKQTERPNFAKLILTLLAFLASSQAVAVEPIGRSTCEGIKRTLEEGFRAAQIPLVGAGRTSVNCACQDESCELRVFGFDRSKLSERQVSSLQAAAAQACAGQESLGSPARTVASTTDNPSPCHIARAILNDLLPSAIIPARVEAAPVGTLTYCRSASQSMGIVYMFVSSCQKCRERENGICLPFPNWTRR